MTVTSFDPGRGWREADVPRRVAAVLALPAAASLTAALAVRRAPGVVLVLWLLVGPALHHSLARVLRPEARSAGRTTRHLLAAAGTAVALPLLLSFGLAYLGGPFLDGDTGYLVLVGYGLGAAALGVITLGWGVVEWFRQPWAPLPQDRARPRRR